VAASAARLAPGSNTPSSEGTAATNGTTTVAPIDMSSAFAGYHNTIMLDRQPIRPPGPPETAAGLFGFARPTG
jgi:hypothetical protein